MPKLMRKRHVLAWANSHLRDGGLTVERWWELLRGRGLKLLVVDWEESVLEGSRKWTSGSLELA